MKNEMEIKEFLRPLEISQATRYTELRAIAIIVNK